MDGMTISDKEIALRQEILKILKGLPPRYQKEILRLCMDKVERDADLGLN
jgi:hypothetical protein